MAKGYDDHRKVLRKMKSFEVLKFLHDCTRVSNTLFENVFSVLHICGIDVLEELSLFYGEI